MELRVALNEAKAQECGVWDPVNTVFLPLMSDRVHPAKAIIIIYRSVLAHGRSRGAQVGDLPS